MSAISSFGRNEHRVITSEILAAARAVAAKYGVELTANGGKIGTGTGEIRLGVSVKNTSSGVSGAEQQFRAHAGWFGIDPNAFGKTFISRGQRYKITGINPNAPKYPIMAEREFDRVAFRFPASAAYKVLP